MVPSIVNNDSKRCSIGDSIGRPNDTRMPVSAVGGSTGRSYVFQQLSNKKIIKLTITQQPLKIDR